MTKRTKAALAAAIIVCALGLYLGTFIAFFKCGSLNFLDPRMPVGGYYYHDDADVNKILHVIYWPLGKAFEWRYHGKAIFLPINPLTIEDSEPGEVSTASGQHEEGKGCARREANRL